MRMVGYGVKVGKHKSIKSGFQAAVDMVATERSVVRSADGWIKTFKRIRDVYNDYIAKIQKSVRLGEDEDLDEGTSMTSSSC